MKTTSRLLTAALLGLTLSTGWCQTSYTNLFSGINAPIPNGKLTGWSDTRRIKLPVAGLITNLQVTLTLSGGFNGDLYGYLVHGSGFAVLLNRPGRTATDTVGYADSGFDVSFGTGALNDIHLYQGVTGPVSPLTGLWAADGREAHPLSVVDTVSRTALLDSFVGVNPTGDWTLFLADVDGGGSQATVVSWSLILMVDPAPVPLTVTAHGVSKTYDGNTTAAVTFTDDRGAGDTLTYTYNASFEDKNVGAGKAVSVSDILVGGPDASRYTLVNTTASTTASITPAPLTVTGITASNKTYDGTTAATVDISGATLVGIIGGEDVTLNTAGAIGAFADKNVGTGKTVKVSGLTIGGGDFGNYSLTQPTATANITKATLNVSANGTLVYGRDPTNAVYAPVYYPLLGSDTPNGFSGSATFGTDATATSYVGSNYVVTVVDTGTLMATNYTFANGTNGIMAVTPALLVVTNVTASDKVYDGDTTATINISGAGLDGLVNGDEASVTLDKSSVTGVYADPHAGIGKTVFFSGFVTAGDLGTNYTLIQPTTTANISRRVAQLSGSLTYNGTTTLPAAGLSVVNNIDGGNLTLSGTASVASRNVGSQSIILTNYATPTRVRFATGTTGGNASSFLLSLAGLPPVDGNTLIAVIATRGSAAANGVSSIVSVGATWTRAARAFATNGTAISATEIWYAPNVSNATTAVTVNQPGSYRSAGVLMEYNGILSADALDQTATATNNTTAAVTGTTAPTALASELWIGGIGLVNSTITLGTPLNSFTTVGSAQSTSGTGSSNAKVYALEYFATATGAANSGGTLSGTGNWSGAIATFKAQDSTALALAGPAAADYTLNGATGAVTANPAPLTVTAQANSKVYDGTTTSATAPSITTGSIQPGDAANFGQSYDTKHVGTGKTLTPSGSVSDGNGGANYNVTFANNTSGVITAKAITVTAVANSKLYDGATTAAAVPGVSPALASGDTANFRETYVTPNIGTGKTLNPSGSVTDGNNGANYTVTFVRNTSGGITPNVLTVTGIQASDKVYDGTNTATLNLTNAVLVGVVDSEDVYLSTTNVTGAFTNKNVGISKTVQVSGLELYGADSANYSLAQPATNASIAQLAITVTAVTDSKVYDGNTSSAGIPTVSPAVATGDTANFVETYANKNVGTGKTLAPSGSVNDGNGGANYALTFASNTTGVITPKPISVTAVTDTKVYDGHTSSGGVPTVSPGVANGDTAQFVQAFDTKHVGTGKTLTPSGSVSDGNGGANYAISFASDTAGVINPLPITVTAVTSTKVYDGNTSSVGIPTVSPGVAGGDTANFAETYDTKNVGTGKTLSPSGLVTDGNGGANYAVTFANDTTGEVSAKPITVTAVTDSKVYDGHTSSVGIPTVSPGLSSGDTANFAQAFATKHVGTGKTLIPSGNVTDGNVGANYAVTFANDTTGVITAKPITVTAVTSTKGYDGHTGSVDIPTVSPGLASGDTANFSQTYDAKNVGTGKTLTPSGSASDGNGGANYNVTFADTATGTITQTNITVTAATNTKPYDGTTVAAAIPTVTSGSVQAGDTANFTETYDNANVGTGKTLTPAGTLVDGNGGANYNISFVNDTTGVITPPCSQTNEVVSMVNNGDGTFTLTLVGTPQAEYYVVASVDAAARMSNWLPVAGSTNTVTNLSGLWHVTVTNAGPHHYYRGAAVAPCP